MRRCGISLIDSDTDRPSRLSVLRRAAIVWTGPHPDRDRSPTGASSGPFGALEVAVSLTNEVVRPAKPAPGSYRVRSEAKHRHRLGLRCHDVPLRLGRLHPREERELAPLPVAVDVH